MIISDNESQRDYFAMEILIHHSIIIILNAHCLLRLSNSQIDKAQNKLLLQHRYVARASPNSRIHHFDSIQ